MFLIFFRLSEQLVRCIIVPSQRLFDAMGVL
jgi:hypothetical protein